MTQRCATHPTENLLPPSALLPTAVYQRRDGTWGANYDVSAQVVRFLTPRGEGVAVEEEEAPEDDIPF
jgi:hypothetical protein